MYKKTLTTGCHSVLKWCFPPFKVSYATSISIVVPFESHVKKAMSYTFFSFTLICIGAYSFSNTTFPSSPSPYAPPVSKLLLLPLLLRRSPIASSSSSSSSSSSAYNNNNRTENDDDFSNYFQSLKKQPWDALPKPWKEFWGMRPAGYVLNVDNEKQTVNANEIESPSLNFPQTKEEGVERLKSNLVYYRQNYFVMFVPFCVMFGGFNFWPFLLSSVGFFTAVAAASDKILGEVQLKMEEKNVGMDLTFNKQRVLGMDRKVLMKAGVLFGFFWMTKWVRASDAVAAASKITRMLIRVVILWMMTSAYLAILRPIDLKSTLTNAWGELKDAKSKEDFEKAGKKAWSGVKSWFNQKAREQPQATPIIVNVKGENVNAASQNNNNNNNRTENDWKKGATDADARDASKKGLPPGSAR
mmetsp:Transcript_1939/g.6965  ORF Transcript_1939/g.6965 Transcript_1939/m.6965 type:complete len:414 (-) Transcript_1939:1084-2325(-)